MRELTLDDLSALLAEQRPPCVSLYQPTHRSHPDNQQDPIRYKNMLRELDSTLRAAWPAEDIRTLLQHFRALADERDFWNRRTEGLAILGSPERFDVLDLQRPVPERLVVAESFHTKPLIRILQSADRYHVLCLTRRDASLYEGNRDVLDPVETPNVPAKLTDALGEELTEPRHAVRSIPGQTGIHHGAGQRKDEVDLDTERFFRAVDRAVLEHHSRPSGLPLMVAALAEHHTPFRAVSRNPHLMTTGIEADPSALSVEELRARAWQLVEPAYLERLAALLERYGTARARAQGTDDLSDAARAIVEGRVATLLVEAERLVPGQLDRQTGAIESASLEDAPADDLLDDLAEEVLRKGGEVIVVPAERMPTRTGAAAIYRY